jgi:hypothetical protein
MIENLIRFVKLKKKRRTNTTKLMSVPNASLLVEHQIRRLVAESGLNTVFFFFLNRKMNF